MSRTTLRKTIEGVGAPTIQELKDLIEDLPLDAKVELQNIEGDRPFDPAGWRISVSYTAPEPKKPFHSHPAGYRTGGPKPRGLSPLAQQEQELHDRTQELLNRVDYKENGPEPLIGTPESKLGLIQQPRIVKDNPQA